MKKSSDDHDMAMVGVASLKETQVMGDDEQATYLEDEVLFKYAQPGQACTDVNGTPLLRLDQDEERRLRRKMDRRLLIVIAVVYLFCFIDRANIGNARIAGLERSLNMSGYDFNFLIMAFYVTYAVAEMPLTFIAKAFGPVRVLSICILASGPLTVCFSFVHTLAEAIVVRSFLAVSEAPMLPGLAYYLTRFYRRKELTIRVAVYIAAAPFSGAVGGLFSSAILKLHRIGSLRHWQMLFFVDGLLTIVVGMIAYVALPSSIDKARWLSPREKALATVRLKSENVASVGVVDALRRQMTKRGMFAITPIMCGIAQGIVSITAQSIGFMLPTIIKILYPGRSTPVLQLLTAPPYLVSTCVVLLVAFVVTKKQNFTWFLIGTLATGILGYALSCAYTIHQPHARYAATFLTVICSFSPGPIFVSWVAANNNSDTERAGALAMLTLLGVLASIASAWTFLPYDAPNYERANVANLTLCIAAVLLILVCKVLLRRENAIRANGGRSYRLEGLSPEQHESLGRHHPAFRYLH